MPLGDAIKAVIFDYGGVVAQTKQQAPRALWEQRLGLAPGQLTQLVHDAQVWVAAQHGTITAEAHWQAVGQTLQLTETALADLRATFYAGDVLNEALLGKIADLRKRGLQIGLLSNFSAELRTMLIRQELLPYFDHVVISAEIGVMKPAAAAYEAMLAMLRQEPSACIFIDDMASNVAAAQALGLHGIVFCETTTCLTALDRILCGETDRALKANCQSNRFKWGSRV